MEASDKIKRAVSFYSSVALFFLLLPIVLSYSLGYKIDYRALRIYKTGIIYLKSRPSGASIYINGKELTDVTPSRIEELKPGTYRVDVKRDGFFPWQKELIVRPNIVTKAEDIVLFPLTQQIVKVYDYDVRDFVISDKNYLYYMTNTGLFRSTLDGANMKRLSPYSNWPEMIVGKKFSPDGEKLLYFDKSHIWVIYLNLDKSLVKGKDSVKVEEVLDSPDPIIDVYWYSESRHIVFISDKYINVVELSGGEGERNTVMLYKFNAKPQSLFYDGDNDSLYFTDSSSSKEKSYLYRLDLRQNFFDQLIQRLKKEFEVQYEKRDNL